MTHDLVQGDQDGVTVVEFAVASLIGAIVMALVTSVSLTTLTGVRNASARLDLAADARIALESMTRSLRAATVPLGENVAVTRATPTSIAFYAQLGYPGALVVDGVAVPTLVEYSVSGGCVTQARTPARAFVSGSHQYAWDTGRSSLCLVRTVAPASLFQFFTDATTTSALTAPVTGLVEADRASVTSVGLSFTLTDPARPRIAGVPLSTRVTLGNVALAAGGTA